LYVKGNLINHQSSISVGTSGILYLNGSNTQTVNGSAQFKTYDLETNNSSGIIFNNDLSVSNAHTFTAGVITASSNYLIYEAGSSYSGAGDNKHVNGWVKKIGSTDFIFPVGDGTVERTIALNTISASSEFDVKYMHSTPPNNTNVIAPLLYLDQNEYWNLNKVSGGTAKVTMNWDNSKVPFPNWNLSDVRVASYDGSSWSSAGANNVSGSSTTTGTITSNVVSSFSKFGFGAEAFPLPLTLTSFAAKYMSSYTALNWITVNEENVNHFTVERSDDGVYFYSIVQLPARNSGIREIYTTTDNIPINHIAYYRLRIVDIDGKEKLSKTVFISNDDEKRNLTLLTNPVHHNIALIPSNDLNGMFNYFINGINGQLIQQGKLQIESGGKIELPLIQNLKSGIYTLEVKNNLEAFHLTFIVQ
jgi:hypothetical protein